MASMYCGMVDLFGVFPLRSNVALIPSFLSGVFFFLLPLNLVQVWLYTHRVHAVDGLFVDQLQGFFYVFRVS